MSNWTLKRFRRETVAFPAVTKSNRQMNFRTHSERLHRRWTSRRLTESRSRAPICIALLAVEYVLDESMWGFPVAINSISSAVEQSSHGGKSVYWAENLHRLRRRVGEGGGEEEEEKEEGLNSSTIIVCWLNGVPGVCQPTDKQLFGVTDFWEVEEVKGKQLSLTTCTQTVDDYRPSLFDHFIFKTKQLLCQML